MEKHYKTGKEKTTKYDKKASVTFQFTSVVKWKILSILVDVDKNVSIAT